MSRELVVGDILYREKNNKSFPEKTPLDNYKKYYLLGMTKQSYIVGTYSDCPINYGIKVNKKTMKERGENASYNKFYPEWQIDDAILISKSYEISNRVRSCKNADKLRRIKAILDEE